MNIWGAGELCLVLFLVGLATVTSAVAEKNQQLLILNQPGHQNAKSLGRFSDRVCYDVTKVEYFGTVVEDKHLLDKLSYPLLGRCAALGDLKRFLNDLVLLHQQQG
ncbi:MAG: hypothetical protein OIF35_02715, partial [Cellvibrionaceae bacterium]|nr:hypothetical protein [Cellvibrionaceae bacterium]